MAGAKIPTTTMAVKKFNLRLDVIFFFKQISDMMLKNVRPSHSQPSPKTGIVASLLTRHPVKTAFSTMHKNISACVSVFFYFAALTALDAAVWPSYRSETNIIYGTVAEKNLALNAFLPENATAPTPAIAEFPSKRGHSFPCGAGFDQVLENFLVRSL